jgi:hypothetical protein
VTYAESTAAASLPWWNKLELKQNFMQRTTFQVNYIFVKIVFNNQVMDELLFE